MIDEQPQEQAPQPDVQVPHEQTVDEIERDIYLLNAIMLATE